MTKKVTLQDIAKKAGVGAGTVSRVLNDHPYVSDKKREQVMKAMEDLDYRPSFAARHMRTQQSHLIGFITDEVATTPYAGDIIKGAQDATWVNDKILMVLGAGDTLDRTRASIDVLLEREVEGIIYAAMYHHAIQVPENIRAVPSVLVNCFVEDRSLPSVVPDEFTGGYEATKVLLEKGHERIAVINISDQFDKIPAAGIRQEGYKKALAEYNIAFDESLVFYGDGTPALGYDLGCRILNLSQHPTAIFCMNDRTAMGLFDALKEFNLRIPDDIAVIGFDNQEIISDSLHPSLSTMQLPHYDMGQWAVDFLMDHLNSDQNTPDPIQHLLYCAYVERNSI